MAEKIELAKAYFHLIPSMEGAEGSITKALLPEAEAAGGEAAGKFGAGWKGKMAGGAAIVGGTVAAFKGLYEVGEIFDDVGDTIRIGTGATGKDLEGLIGVAKNVGRRVPVEFENIGTTVADVNTRMGLSGDTLETVSAQFLNASRILGEDVDIMKTGAAFNAFKIEGDAVIGAMDHLFQVSQATGIGMNELAGSISTQAPALQNLGFTFEESAVMIGSFDKAGLNSSQMMSGMARSLVNLAKDGEKPQEAFERTINEIEKFVKAGDEAAALELAGKVFGTRGASQFVGAVQAGVLSLDDLTTAAGQTTDTILDVADETDDFAEKWQLVKNNAALALEPLGSAIFDGLANALSSLMPYIESLGGWLSDNIWVLATLATVIGVTLVAAFVSWTAGIWANTVALLANPMVWITLAVLALVAAIIWVATQTEWFSDIWEAVWGWITDVFDAAKEWIENALEALAAVWDAIWNAIQVAVEAVWNAIKWYIETYINIVKTVITTVIETIKTVWETVWNTIKKVFEVVWDAIKTVVETYINIVKTVITTVIDTIKTVWETAWNTVKNVATTVWEAITGFFEGAVSKFGDMFSGIAEALSKPFKTAFNAIAGFWNNTIGKISFEAPDWIPGIGGRGWSVPNIPLLAKGGVITEATLAVVGEAGPEAVIPLDRLHEFTSNEAPGAAGIHIEVDTLAVREEADIRRVAEELARLIERDRRFA